MKRIITLCWLAIAASAPNANAVIPTAGISHFSMPVYAFYTSTDPTCQTGLTALLPMQSTPKTVDFMASTIIGTGTLANPINCVVLVFQNALTWNWSAGTYTTSTGGTSDSVCNAGGSVTSNICNANVTLSTPPAKITTDATAAGVTLSTSCPATPTGSEVVVVYISTNSLCTFVTATDTGTACFVSGHNIANPFTAAASASSTNGVHLTSVPFAAGATVYMADNPAGSIGAISSTACGNTGGTVLSFTNDGKLR